MRRDSCVVIGLLLVAACSDGTAPPMPPSEDPVASVELVLESPSVAEHGTLEAQVICRDARGRVTTPRDVLWTALDPEIALVSGSLGLVSGTVRGLTPGEARIVARVEDLRDTASVTVTPLPVDHLVFVSTLADTVLLHAKGWVVAYPYAADGYPVTRAVTYASVRPNVATVLANGWVDITGAGAGGVVATSEGKQAVHELRAMTATFTAISAGAEHDCAMATSGQLWCWGAGAQGQLGRGDIVNQATPVPSGGANRFLQFAAGGAHTCGIVAGGSAYCWGDNTLGDLGNGSMGNMSTVPDRVQAPRPFTSISGGQYFTCGVSDEHQGFCWGDNGLLQLGIGVPGSIDLPARAIFDTTFTLIRTGVRNACGITMAGQAVCWGDLSLGQTGGVPAGEPIPGYRFSDITVGDAVVCGLTAAGGAVCWGDALFGATGDGGGNPSGTPAPVVGGLTFAQVSAAKGFACGLTTGGAIYCWGEGWAGALGNGSTDFVRSPTPISSTETFAAVSARGFHACGLTTGGVVYCWGTRNDPQTGLGDGLLSSSTVPVRIPGS